MSNGRLCRQVLISLATLALLVGGARPSARAEERKSRRVAVVDASPEPRLYTSRNFQVMTDLSEERARELLERLETMLKLVSAYFGRPNKRQIEMFVFDDFSNWSDKQLSQLSRDGVAMVRSGGGLTITEGVTNGSDFVARSVVYAGSDHGTPQHEAVHAYCGNAFGGCGPVWYAEGMAEVGNYWRDNDKGVNTDPRIIRYLKSREPRPLNDIVNKELETTGDSWQNYAWRWALCHLLGFNENYTKRFKPLGLALLANQHTDFWEVYGGQAEEIEFEYRQFLKDMEPGYRCDLASWDWKTKFQQLRGNESAQSVIRADHGWQASRLQVTAGAEYQCVASGTVKLTKVEEAPPAPKGEKAPQATSEVTLLGAVLQDYELGDPFEVPKDGRFTAPGDGKLYLRCADAWGSLGDNTGKLTIRMTRADAKERGQKSDVGGQPETAAGGQRSAVSKKARLSAD
ncbi:MAG: hypothetical protein U0992_11875 [Planctomycetaceae bacterium]